MSKIGNFMLKETTRTSLTLANFLILIGTVITIVYAGSVWKSQTEAQILASIERDRVQDERIIENAADIKENNAILVDSQAQFAEIRTDLKWIRAYMEKDR